MKTKLLFSIALLFCFVKSLIAQTFTVDNIKYEVTTPFTVKITGLVDRGVSSVTIPLTVTNNSKTYNVTAIGANAFNGYSSLTSVSISDSVTSIGNYAFFGVGEPAACGAGVVTVPFAVVACCNAFPRPQRDDAERGREQHSQTQIRRSRAMYAPGCGIVL